ncbi:hypothetical protein DRJ17_03355 [Candidatus Woesearchaeota archaeon]|nr:MAG: hypothetical protein DRJ17_03355 [Candidatus Woesearchaeota archaeon]
MQEFQKRLVAHKLWISDILNSRYIKQEGWQPNYIKCVDGREISRVNILGVIVDKENVNGVLQFTLDDGTGQINTRAFEAPLKSDDVDTGNIVQIIGKVRAYNENIYILPEIITKIKDKRWIELRKHEIPQPIQIQAPEKNQTKENYSEEVVEDFEKEETDSEKIYKLIKELDIGDGADFQEIIDKSNLRNAEFIVKNLLATGDIFEVKPGKLKTLD